jgi:hypothetical protein
LLHHLRLFLHKVLSFLVSKIFTFYKNGVLKFECAAPGSKG